MAKESTDKLKKPAAKKPAAKKPAAKKPAAKVEEKVEEEKPRSISKLEVDGAIAEIKRLRVPMRKTSQTLKLLGFLSNTLK